MDDVVQTGIAVVYMDTVGYDAGLDKVPFLFGQFRLSGILLQHDQVAAYFRTRIGKQIVRQTDGRNEIGMVYQPLPDGTVLWRFMQRFLEVANGIPRLVIVTLLLLVLQPGMLTIIFALMLTEWVGMSRIARAEMLKLKEQEFVLASRTLGAGNFFIIFKEVLPNIIGPIITQVMFSIPTAIFTEAFLSFVGLGIPVPQCSLGSLISEGFNSFTTHPYQIIPPIVVMALLMLSFNLVADGLREALDPKLKEM